MHTYTDLQEIVTTTTCNEVCGGGEEEGRKV